MSLRLVLPYKIIMKPHKYGQLLGKILGSSALIIGTTAAITEFTSCLPHYQDMCGIVGIIFTIPVSLLFIGSNISLGNHVLISALLNYLILIAGNTLFWFGIGHFFGSWIDAWGSSKKI